MVIVSQGARAQQEGDLFSSSDEHYEVYAPDRVGLKHANRALNQAAGRYQRFIGEAPPRTALVLYETPQQREAYSERQLGLPTYTTSAASRGQRRVSVWPEARVLLTSTRTGLPEVLTTYPDGPRQGLDLRPGDVILATGNETLESLEELFQRESEWEACDRPNLTVLRDRSRMSISFGYPGADETPMDPSVLRQALRSAPLNRPSVAHLAHEAAHTMLKASFASLSPWFHEGFASLAEPPHARRLRSTALHGNQERWIPWKELFAMDHPVEGAMNGEKAKAGDRGHAVITQRESIFFYSQSMSILRWLAERYGDRSVGELARWLASGHDASEFGPEGHDGSERLIALEGSWRRWVMEEAK